MLTLQLRPAGRQWGCFKGEGSAPQTLLLGPAVEGEDAVELPSSGGPATGALLGPAVERPGSGGLGSAAQASMPAAMLG